MTAHSKWRGHDIKGSSTGWVYSDTGESVLGNPTRPCGKCGGLNRSDEYDPCLAKLPGVINACCGHGDRDASYIQFKNGVIVRGFIKDK